MRYAPAILLGRLVRFAARLRKPGGGSAFPGLVVDTVAPGYLASTLSGFRDGLVVVSGSSGKSTTTKMLVALLEAHGVSVFTNPSTANIRQGLTSALLERSRLDGSIDAQIAVLEMDEGHGAAIAPSLSPRLVLLTNVMTDQIDRFHDSEKVAGMLQRIAVRATETLVTNGDDAMLEAIAAPLESRIAVQRYGVSDQVLAATARGLLGYAQTTEHRIGSGTIVGAVNGRSATIVDEQSAIVTRLPARGVHYAVDAAAAIAAARALLPDFDAELAAETISGLDPVFGRGEVTTVRGRKVEFVLVQNPASFQLNVDELPTDLDQVLIAMGSDVRDPSYFWPVDSSPIGRASIVSGSKAYAMALQLHYQGVDVDRVEPDLARALDDFFQLPDPARGVKTVIFTADAMRRTRVHLGLAG